MNYDKFIEDGASLEHDRWARWQKHFFSKCKIEENEEDVILTLSKKDYSRWLRQIATDYKDLSEEEKESDRREVEKYIPLLKNLNLNK